jgi:hypothetical protein
VRRYTHVGRTGDSPFGLFYVVMSVGALVAGPLVDALTAHYHRGKDERYYDHGGGGDSFDVDGGDAIVAVAERRRQRPGGVGSGRCIVDAVVVLCLGG